MNEKEKQARDALRQFVNDYKLHNGELTSGEYVCLRDGFDAGLTYHASETEPLNMILPCPACGMLHVDAAEPNICTCKHNLSVHKYIGDSDIADCQMAQCACRNFSVTWDNPNHKSHKCHGCGIIWRPADVPTNGVAQIKTKGKNDTWSVHVQSTGD